MADPKLEATCTALHAVLLSNFHLNGHSRLSFEWSHDFKDLVHLLKCLTCTA